MKCDISWRIKTYTNATVSVCVSPTLSNGTSYYAAFFLYTLAFSYQQLCIYLFEKNLTCYFYFRMPIMAYLMVFCAIFFFAKKGGIFSKIYNKLGKHQLYPDTQKQCCGMTTEWTYNTSLYVSFFHLMIGKIMPFFWSNNWFKLLGKLYSSLTDEGKSG